MCLSQDEDLDILDRANGDRANGASASEGEYQDESGEFDDQHGDFDDQHGDFDDQAGEFDGQAGESDGEPDDEVDQHSELLRDLPRDSPRVLDGLSTAEEAAAAMAAGGGDVDGEEADDALTHKQRLAREFAEQARARTPRGSPRDWSRVLRLLKPHSLPAYSAIWPPGRANCVKATFGSLQPVHTGCAGSRS